MEETAGTKVLLSDPKKAIPALAVPLAVAIFVQNFNSMADTMWAAWLGGSAVAGLGLAYPLYATIVGIGNGLGIGAASAIARCVGLSDRRGASLSAAQALLLAFIASMMVTIPLTIFVEPLMDAFGAGEAGPDAVAYGMPIFVGSFFIIAGSVMSGILRGEGAARRSMIIQAAGALFNIVLDPILMYVCGMGVAGAGIATVAAGALSLCLGLRYYIGRDDMYVKFRISDLRPDRHSMKEILCVGLPESAEYMTMSLINIPMNYIIVGIGDPNVIGTYTSAWRVAYLVLIPCQALSGGVVSVCSAEFARGRSDLMREAYRFTARRSVIHTFYLSVLLALLSYPIACMFTASDDITYLRHNMTVCLLCLAALSPVFSMVFVGSAFLQSLEHSEMGFLSSLIRNIVMVSSYFAVAVTLHSSEAIWVVMAVIEILGGLLMAWLAKVYIRRFSRRCPCPDPEPVL